MRWLWLLLLPSALGNVKLGKHIVKYTEDPFAQSDRPDCLGEAGCVGKAWGWIPIQTSKPPGPWLSQRQWDALELGGWGS